jgi:holo-[acyl-carrier protein] synthase
MHDTRHSALPGFADRGRRSARVRVGTDIESVADVGSNISLYGRRYADRLFTEHELQSCGYPDASAADGLAARFASKEATLKVLRPTDRVPSWRSIEVRKHRGGWCSLRLTGEAAALADEQGLAEFDLSLSHGAGFGTATVVALAAGDRR